MNVPRLVDLLQKYNPQEDWYLGKPSIRAPLNIMNRDDPTGVSAAAAATPATTSFPFLYAN